MRAFFIRFQFRFLFPNLATFFFPCMCLAYTVQNSHEQFFSSYNFVIVVVVVSFQLIFFPFLFLLPVDFLAQSYLLRCSCYCYILQRYRSLFTWCAALHIYTQQTEREREPFLHFIHRQLKFPPAFFSIRILPSPFFYLQFMQIHHNDIMEFFHCFEYSQQYCIIIKLFRPIQHSERFFSVLWLPLCYYNTFDANL